MKVPHVVQDVHVSRPFQISGCAPSPDDASECVHESFICTGCRSNHETASNSRCDGEVETQDVVEGSCECSLIGVMVNPSSVEPQLNQPGNS